MIATQPPYENQDTFSRQHWKAQAIIHSVFCRVHVEQSADARGLDLVFRNIQSEDEGEYSCEAIIDGRKEQKIFHLKVIGKSFLFNTIYSTVSTSNVTS